MANFPPKNFSPKKEATSTFGNSFLRFLKFFQKLLFLFFLIAFIWTSFSKRNYRNAQIINEKDLFEDPKQTELEEHEKNRIQAIKDGYLYEITPLYKYEISALVVNRFDYTKFSLRKYDHIIPLDLCLMWGENLKNDFFRDKSLTFRQDSRFCQFIYLGKDRSSANLNQFSNNHLVILSNSLQKKAMEIYEGDQVRIKGKLIKLNIKNIDGKKGKYDIEEGYMTSSVSRTDTGNGACEVILVEAIDILKKGNILSHWINKISFYGIILIILIKVISFFIEIILFEKRTKIPYQNLRQ